VSHPHRIHYSGLIFLVSLALYYLLTILSSLISLLLKHSNTFPQTCLPLIDSNSFYSTEEPRLKRYF